MFLPPSDILRPLRPTTSLYASMRDRHRPVNTEVSVDGAQPQDFRRRALTIRVLVGDSQPLLGEALALALGRFPELTVAAEYPSSRRRLIEAATRHRPDVILVDYWMPGIDGPAAAEEILEELKGFRVIFLYWFFASYPWFDAPGDIERALGAGAVGFIPKHFNVEAVARAATEAHEGKAPVLAQFLECLLERMKRHRQERSEVRVQLKKLTPRETEILELLGKGRRVNEIAELLAIRPTTARTHVQNVLNKTGTHSTIEAIALARHFGVISG